jgi:hypothetical protein
MTLHWLHPAASLFAFASLCSSVGYSATESYKFNLHKFEQPIGVESVAVSPQAGMDQVNHISFVLEMLLPKKFDRSKATPADSMNALTSIDMNSEAAQHMIATLKQHSTVIDDTAALFELFVQPTEPGIANVAPELREQFKSFSLPPARVPLEKARWSKTLEII